MATCVFKEHLGGRSCQDCSSGGILRFKMNYWWMLALLVLSVCDVGWCVVMSTSSNLRHVQTSDNVAGMREESQQNISDASVDYSNDCAVEVNGGALAADTLASASGFINMGQV